MKTSLRMLALTLLAVLACGQPSGSPVPVPVPPVADETVLSVGRPHASVSVPPPLPPLSAAEQRIAACTGAPTAGFPQGQWRCAGKAPTTFAAGGTSSPIIPSSWRVASWFVNKTTGNDGNDCITALTACATKQEIWVHRWGMTGSGSGNCPRFQQTTTLEQDVSDSDNTDPIYPCAALEKGASLIIQGGPPASTAATFTLNTAKNTAAGTNALLSGSFSAGAPAAGVLVQNTTAAKSSRAWVYKTAGGANWNMTQPLVPVTSPPVVPLPPTEVNTWASLDTVNVLVPIAINIASADATVTDPNGAFTNALYLYNLTIFDPLGAGSSPLSIGQNVIMLEVGSQRFVSFGGRTGSANVAGRLTSNVFFQGGVQGFGGGFMAATVPGFVGDPTIQGGAMLLSPIFNGPPLFNADVIWSGNGALDNGAAITGNLFLDGNIVNWSGTIVETGASTKIYGSGSNTIDMKGSTHFWQDTGQTFQSTFTAPGLVTGIKLNGAGTGSSSTSAGVLSPGITLTPAHLDAAQGAAGCGGTCFNPAGASVSNTL